MRAFIASRIMPRTTIDIDAGVLRELKARGRKDGRSIGAVASELLARALRAGETPAPQPIRWNSRPMGARVDLEDTEAVSRALDGR